MLKFRGISDQTAQFLQEMQLSDAVQWAKFVDVYRSQPDAENQGWRGEYWGKMMRGGALVYEYTQDEGLYEVLTASVRDMMTAAEPDGRVSSYERDKEFDSWDLWCRKYVILASEYYYNVCKDEKLKSELLAFLCRCVDYIIAHIGPYKKKITKASRSWYGINSSSILEPIVRLYKLTGEKKYLDFAAYIVEEGGADGINIFELAYENKLYPYQYGVSKAYELTSCFEGLLEYYEATGIEKYRIAVENYARAVLASEISIIGSCGVTHELFDHTRTRQTVKYDGVVQETCVTVTWMKFCSRLLALTGDSVFADEMERSFYNAYVGALNTEKHHSANVRNSTENIVQTYMPFDSYSPLVPGLRGQKVGGFQLMPDKSYYGCCACIGAAGVGVFLRHAVTADEDGVIVNFYETGTVQVECKGVGVTLEMETDYPVDGKIKIRVKTEKRVEFDLRTRNPGWADMPAGYTSHVRTWSDDTIELNFDMPLKIHCPEHWEEDVVYIDGSLKVPGYVHVAGPMKVVHKDEEDRYFAVTRGPLTLAADSRTGKSADSVFAPTYAAEKCENVIADGAACLLKLKFSPENGEPYYLVDYASAGRDWDTLIAAWLPTE